MSDMKVREWLASDRLQRIARRVAHNFGLPSQDVPDLCQDLCLALLKADPDQLVNATWVFHTGNHRAVELIQRERKRRQMAETVPERIRKPSTADPELASLVHAGAARLPDSLRRFYRLRYEEGFTQQEIVQRKHLPRGLVRGMEKQCLRRMTGRRI